MAVSNLVLPCANSSDSASCGVSARGGEVRVAQVVVAVDQRDDARQRRHAVGVQLEREAAAVGVLVVLRDHQRGAGRQAHLARLRHAVRDVLLVEAQSRRR